MNPADGRPSVVEIIDNYRTCEFTTFSRDGHPQTAPVSPLLLDDGRLFLATSIGLAQKALNVRRNQRVSMLFSEPSGSGVRRPAAVLVQGDAIAEDRVVADVTAVPELKRLVEITCERQSAGAFMSSAVGRRLFPAWYMRLLIYVTPRRVLWWPTRDFTAAPEEVGLEALHSVG